MKELNLHTYDIQYLIIALVNSDGDKVIGDRREYLMDKLAELNRMCRKENNYTLTITVND